MPNSAVGAGVGAGLSPCGCCYEEEITELVHRHVQYAGTICTPEGFLRDYEPEGVHPDTWEYGRCITNHFECPGGSLVAIVLDLAEKGDLDGIAVLAALNPDVVSLNRSRNAAQISSCADESLMAHIPIAGQSVKSAGDP